jgi:hypothetical protein
MIQINNVRKKIVLKEYEKLYFGLSQGKLQIKVELQYVDF